MAKKSTALAMAAVMLGSAMIVPAPAHADWSAVLFFAFCKRQNVDRFEPFTGEVYTVEKWVCDFP